MIAQKIFEEPEIYKVEIPYENIITKETNIYIVRDSGDVLVIDMGAPTREAAAVFVQALEELGISLDAPSYFFTHLHFDHSGMASEVLPKGSHVYVGRKEMRSGEAGFYKKMKNFVKGRFIEEGMTLHAAEEKAAMVEIATTLDPSSLDIELVSEGDIITVGRFPFAVIDLFGHTRGMLGLYQPESGVCFSGDQLLFCITPACGLFLDGVDSIDAYASSMEKLVGLPITHLLHSHGEIRADFRERAAKILESREKRMGKAISYIAENPGRDGIEVIQNMGWRIPFESIDECEYRQQWLIYTQGIAMLDHLARVGRIERKREPALTGTASMLNSYYPADYSADRQSDDFVVADIEFEMKA